MGGGRCRARVGRQAEAVAPAREPLPVGNGWFIGHWSGSPTYSTFALGYGSTAFLLTIDVWAEDGLDASDAGSLPEYYYAIGAMSKRHNLLMLSFMGATLAQTKAAAVSVLTSGGF